MSLLDALVRRTRDDVLVLDQGPLYTLSRVLAARPDLADDRWLTGRIERWAERLDAVLVLDAPDRRPGGAHPLYEGRTMS